MLQRDEILQWALGLPLADRAFVAAALENSLTPDSNDASATPSRDPATIVDEEFVGELQRRSANYRAGTTLARPAAEVLADLSARQANETRP